MISRKAASPKDRRHGDEQRRHDRGVISLARNEPAEDRARAGGKYQPPDEGEPADRTGEVIHGPLHLHEQIGADHGNETRIEQMFQAKIDLKL